MSYSICTDDNEYGLALKVQKNQKEGWECVGGVSVTLGITGEIWAQAMVKKT